MPDMKAILQRERWRCRSTRLPPSPSTMPTMAPPFSTWRWKDTSTAGLAILPTRSWERRLAALESGVGALSVPCGASAVHYSVANIVEAGANIVSVPQLYGATYTLFAHILPKQGVQVRFATDDGPSAIEALIDANMSIGFESGPLIGVQTGPLWLGFMIWFSGGSCRFRSPGCRSGA